MKKNSKPISKRCSKANVASAVLSVSLLAALLSSPTFAAPTPARPSLEAQLRSEIEAHSGTKTTSFENLLERWQKTHGSRAIDGLQKIAADRALKDQARYIGMMAAVRLGGPSAVPKLLAQASDASWMVRSGVLKAIELTHVSSGSAVAEKMLHDPALVIRTQALETLIELQPPGLTETLVAAAFDPINYRGGDFSAGRAQWVPQRALAGLRKIGAKNVSARLVPLLEHSRDSKLRAHALFTIETLEGRKLAQAGSFEKRAQAWIQFFAKNGAAAAK